MQRCKQRERDGFPRSPFKKRTRAIFHESRFRYNIFDKGVHLSMEYSSVYYNNIYFLRCTQLYITRMYDIWDMNTAKKVRFIICSMSGDLRPADNFSYSRHCNNACSIVLLMFAILFLSFSTNVVFEVIFKGFLFNLVLVYLYLYVVSISYTYSDHI